MQLQSQIYMNNYYIFSVVSTVEVTESYTDEATIGEVTSVTHNTEAVYKAILTFSHSVPGVEKICFTATDVNK